MERLSLENVGLIPFVFEEYVCHLNALETSRSISRVKNNNKTELWSFRDHHVYIPSFHGVQIWLFMDVNQRAVYQDHEYLVEIWLAVAIKTEKC